MNQEIQQASQRWINEGKAYKNAINSWLDIIYVDKKNPSTDCPEETRKDMGEYVINQLVEYNKQGKHKEFRELFPPDNDPLGEHLGNGSWYNIRKVCLLADGRIIAKIGGYHQWQGVYVIQDEQVTLVENIIGFGFSQDKKYIAKVYNDKITIHEGWDGPAIHTFAIPEGYTVEQLKYDSIEVFADGSTVILVTHHGVFLVNETKSELIHGKLAGEENDEEEEDNDVEDEDDNEDEPQRPANVPAEAKWNSGDNEWALGKKNAEGNPIGEWKWWLAPKGYLCCHTFYEGNEGNIFSFTRYHEDGLPSRIGKYVDGQPLGTITWMRSEKPTIEQYPPNAGANVWKTVSTIQNGYTVEEHYYDREGNEIQDAYISNVEMSELLKKTGVANRLYVEQNWKHLLVAANDVIESELAEDEDEEQMKATYYKAWSIWQLNNNQVTEELIELADAIIDLDTFTLWPYLSEHNVLRSALRFAYYLKAQQAINEEDYDEAWSQLQQAFENVSPIDEEDMTPYKKMKAFLATKTDITESDEDENEACDNCKEDNKYNKYKFLDYPHAALSPDGKYIATGSYATPHIVLKKDDNGTWVETSSIEARSSYPNIACFNYEMSEPLLALGSCHFSQSATLGVKVNELEGLEASGYQMDSEALFVIDDQKWIFSMLPSKRGFFLGANDGYIWVKITYNKADYLYIGGTIMSIDIAPDRKHIVVGTASGQVILLRWENIEPKEGQNPRVDPYLITNLPVVDEKRYVFMAGVEPMIW